MKAKNIFDRLVFEMNASPQFTVIMVDYDQWVPREILKRGIECFANQTSQDFELLLYHDGPKQKPYEEELSGCKLPENIKFFESDMHENNWGHSNRNRGIYEARGNWIIHTNADNIFYPFALQELATAIEQENWAMAPVFREKKGLFSRGSEYDGTKMTRNWDALVFPIILHGYAAVGNDIVRFPEHEEELSVVLSGVPVRHNEIDAMQFVMKREIWINRGGWYDTSLSGDGRMYQSFANDMAIYQVKRILGEHW